MRRFLFVVFLWACRSQQAAAAVSEASVASANASASAGVAVTVSVDAGDEREPARQTLDAFGKVKGAATPPLPRDRRAAELEKEAAEMADLLTQGGRPERDGLDAGDGTMRGGAVMITRAVRDGGRQ